MAYRSEILFGKCRCLKTVIAIELEGEGQARPRHAEIVTGTFYDVPAEISHKTDVRRDSDLQTTAELTGKAAFVLRSGEPEAVNLMGLVVDTSKDATHAAPNIRGETRTVYWITERERG